MGVIQTFVVALVNSLDKHNVGCSKNTIKYIGSIKNIVMVVKGGAGGGI